MKEIILLPKPVTYQFWMRSRGTLLRIRSFDEFRPAPTTTLGSLANQALHVAVDDVRL